MLCIPCTEEFLKVGDLLQNTQGKIYDRSDGPAGVRGTPVATAVAVIDGKSVCLDHLKRFLGKQ